MKKNASVIAPDLDISKVWKTNIESGYLYTKIYNNSLPHTVRTCTIYYQYGIKNKQYKSRTTFRLIPGKASVPSRWLKGTEDITFSFEISLCIEPIRIHHWSYDHLIDYQQDIMINRYIKYEWIMNKENGYQPQSDIFGNCWCLQLYPTTPHLKLLKLPPNITRFEIECSITSRNAKRTIDYYGDGEVGFYGINFKLNTGKTNDEYDCNKDTIHDIEIEIIKVYIIDDDNVDDFEFEDVEIPIEEWSNHGII